MEELYIASRVRAFLENLSGTRLCDGVSKNLSQKEIEIRLETLCQIQGLEELN